jgi:small-conductance mechanosensitive channel
MPSPFFSHLRLRLSVFLFLALAITHVSGQASPTPTVTEQAPIAASDVVSQADSISIHLRELESELASNQTLKETNENLSDVTRHIDELSTENTKLLEGNPPLTAIRSTEEAWQMLSKKLEASKSALASKVTQLDTQIDQLNDSIKKWQATLAKSSTMPPEITARIKIIIPAITHAAQSTQSLRSQILSAQNRISEQDARIATTRTALDKARDSAVNRLFIRNISPLWEAEIQTRVSQEGAAANKESLLAQVQEFRAYLSEKASAVFIQLFLFVFLTILLFWMRKEISAHVSQKSMPQMALILDIPVATAALLALAFGHWFYSLAPRLFVAVLGVAALMPAVIVLRRLLQPSLFPILYAMVVSYFFDQGRYVLAESQISSRLLFLFEMAIGSLFILWLLRSKQLPHATVRQNFRIWTIRTFAHSMLILFCLAGLTNVLGYVRLASLVGNATLQSAYLAIILYAGVRIVDGMAMSLLHLRPFSLLRIVRNHDALLHENIFRALRWITFFIWLVVTLELFSIRTPLWRAIHFILKTKIDIGALEISPGPILAFALILWISFLFSRFVRFALEEEVYTKLRLAEGIPYAASTMIHYAILILGFLVASSALGLDMTKFMVVAGALGVGVGLGLQNIMNNFVSGIVLLFERPVKVGDIIQVDAAVGVVKNIGMRATIIRLDNGAEVIIPNGSIISSQVTNWTLTRRQRMVAITFAVSSKSEPQQVSSLLVEVAKNHPRVLKEPPPEALCTSFTTASLTFELRAWISTYDEWIQIRSDLTLSINEILAKNNIALA